MLIACPDCNQQVSDKAEACLQCGYPVNQIKNLSCPDCGEAVSSQDSSCPNCGCPIDSITRKNTKFILNSGFLDNLAQKPILGLIYCLIGGAIIGYLSANLLPIVNLGYSDLFLIVREEGEPFTSERSMLIPGHILLFTNLFFIFYIFSLYKLQNKP